MKKMKVLLSILCTFSVFNLSAQDYLISGPSQIQTCGGTFYDNGGPSGNHNSNDYTQTYTSFNGDRLRFDFNVWSVAQFSTLHIYDGPDASYPLIGLYDFFSGSPGIIESTGTTLHFDFDGLNSGIGWEANITCIPALPFVTMQAFSTDTLCEGVIFDSGGAGLNYGNNEDMITVIEPQTPNDYLSVDFPTRFNLGPGDTLFVYNGTVANGDLLGIYLGYNQHETIVSRHPGESLSFHFKSDSAGTAQGWQGEISCSAQPPVAQYTMGSGIRYFACGGQFYDDGGQHWDYQNNQDKTLTLVSNSGCHIGLDFSQWNMFTYDEIFVYDGTSVADPLLGHFVHYNPPPNIVTATGTAMTIRFVSTIGNNEAGWAADIFCGDGINPQILIDQGSLTGCDGDSIALSLPSAAIYSWNTGDVDSSIYVTTTGAYSATLTDSSGCIKATDTVNIVMNPNPSIPIISASGPLEFCQGDSVVLTSSIDSSYHWSSGATANQITAISSGLYDVTTYNEFNCGATSSQIEVIVNPIPSTPIITANGQTLTSSAVSGNQWYKDGVPIPGATNASLTTTENGLYTVIVTENGCSSDSSAPYNIQGMSLGKNGFSTIRLYPNPTAGFLNIESSELIRQIGLFNAQGQLIVEQSENTHSLNLSEYPRGIYWLQIVVRDQYYMKKVVLK